MAGDCTGSIDRGRLSGWSLSGRTVVSVKQQKIVMILSRIVVSVNERLPLENLSVASARSVAESWQKKRHDDDLDVEKQRPVSDIAQIFSQRM